MITPRSIATLGIGFGPDQIARIGLWLEAAEAGGSGEVVSGASEVSGLGNIRAFRAGSTAGANVGRRGGRFNPRWVEDAWRDELHRIGAGQVEAPSSIAEGTGDIRRLRLIGGGSAESPDSEVSGGGRVARLRLLGAGAVSAPTVDLSGRGDVFDVELELLLTMAVAHG